MFSQIRRATLRRCLHSQASHSLPKPGSSRLAFTLAASATVISYSTWRWTREPIALDSATIANSAKSPALDGPASETHHTSPSPSKQPGSNSELSSAPNSETGEAEAESEASAADGASQGAYNPVTGEINWDCPCLGGMAHGPCGPEFREAFSCFIYSEEEPKGINCVEKFQAMQTCFRAHPEVYADEIMDDEEAEAEGVADAEKAGAPSSEETPAPTSTPQPTKKPSSSPTA